MFAFDARLALRGLRRDWAYAVASVVMLALALALNTTVFTVMDAMLFRGFPHVPRNDRLVFLQEHDRIGRCCLSYADAEAWQAQARSFTGLAVIGGTSVTFRDAQGRPMDLRVTTVGANLFGLLGVAPVLGRDFTPADAAAGAAPVVLLTDRLWQGRFGGRADIVGAIVQIDGAPAEIIGVMPPGFEFPEASSDGLWMPVVASPDLLRRGLTPGGYTAAARLRENVRLPQAQAELEALNHGLERAYPESNGGLVPSVVDYAQFTSGADARVIWGSLWAASCVVLLIACANVANLTVVRTVGRRREFTTCLALGSGRRRLMRQMVLESVVLVAAASGPAWAFTVWSMTRWAALAESRFQVVDYRVTSGTLAYLAVAGALTAVLVSLAPVLRVWQLAANGPLQGDGRGVTQGRRTRRLITTLVAAQMALAVVLMAGSGVLVRSFVNIVGAPIGVRDPASVLVGRLRLPTLSYPTPEARLAFFDRVQARLSTVAGVDLPSASGGLPVKFSGGSRQIEIEGQPTPPGEARSVGAVTTAPDYFAVIGARIDAGRDFTADDRATTAPVAIVNERFAVLHWPGQAALGKRLRFIERDRPGPWRLVVGVASNIMDGDALRQQFKPLVYLPMRQEPPARAAFFLARTRGPADRFAAAVRADLLALDGDVRVDYLDTLQGTVAFDRDYMDAQHSELGKYSKVAPIFAIVALALAGAGLFAVIVHSVTQRTREIGVRMAIGAAASDIIRLVLGEGLRPVAIGLVVGLAAACGVNRILQSQLVGVSPYDPLVLFTAPVVLVLVALAACRVPVRRALRVDPAVALRQE